MAIGIIFTKLFSIGLVLGLVLYILIKIQYEAAPENDRDVYRTLAGRILGFELIMLAGFLISSPPSNLEINNECSNKKEHVMPS